MGNKGLLPMQQPLMSLAWSLSELLTRRDSSFGQMDPKDRWDWGCLRCSQMDPERGMAHTERPVTWWILICMGPFCIVHNGILAHGMVKVSKLITSSRSSPGEEQDYHESAQSSYLRHELYFSTQSALGWTRMPPATIQDCSAGRHLQEQSFSPSSLLLSWHFLQVNILQNDMSRH